MTFLLLSMFLVVTTFFIAPLVLTRALYNLVQEIFFIYIKPKFDQSNDPARRFGAWAAITGATDGIGKGYAFSLAKKGMNILLIARNGDKLAKVKQELQDFIKSLSGTPAIEVKTFTYDFTKAATSEDVSIFEKQFKSCEENGGLGVLVNNVGICPTSFATFQSAYAGQSGAMEQLTEYCQVNILSYLQMCLAALPVMRRQKRGAIVNISSVSALDPQSGHSIYGSTKCFVHNFSRALRQDLLSDKETENIHVQTVAPGCVETKLLPEILYAKSAIGRFFVPQFQTYTDQAVETIGRLVETHGCIGHRLLAYAIIFGRLIPTKQRDRMVTSWVCAMREKMNTDAKKSQ